MLENGNVLTSGGNKVCEVTPDGQEVWSYQNKGLIKTEIHSCQYLEDGTILVAGYDSGYSLFAVNRDKEILWTCKSDAIGKPTNVKMVKRNI